MINDHEFRVTGVVERDAQDNHTSSDNKSQQANGNDSITIPTSRQHEPGVIRYLWDDKEVTIQFSATNINGTAALFCGDKVSRIYDLDSVEVWAILGGIYFDTR